jgi:hypothetical protein
MTIYGDPPFNDPGEAVDWAQNNPVTNLSGQCWHVVPLERTVKEADLEEEEDEGPTLSHASQEDDKHPRSDWRYEVANKDTQLGYAEWLFHCQEMTAMDEEGVPSAGHCPDDGCPGVLGTDGVCSHCGSNYEEKQDEQPDTG